MPLLRIVTFALLMMLLPGTARASLWDWIQEMSGPGPFNGRGSVLATVCSTKDSASGPSWLISNNRTVRSDDWYDKAPCWFFDLRQLAYDPRDGNFPAAVNLTAHDFGVTWQLLKYRPLEVGVGGGLAHFSGVNDVTANRFSFTIPRVVVAPIALVLYGNDLAKKPLARLVKIHYGYLWIPGSVNAEDFGVVRGTGPGQSTFSEKGEFLKSYGFFIDLGELFRRGS